MHNKVDKMTLSSWVTSLFFLWLTWNKTHLSRSSNMSGKRKFNKDQSSDKLFCNGVPVSSKRFAVLYVFNSLMNVNT